MAKIFSLIKYEKKEETLPSFENAFYALTMERINENGVMELSARKYFSDNAKKGVLSKFVVKNNLPIEKELHETIDSLVKFGADYIDNNLKDSFLARNKDNIINVLSDLGKKYIDEKTNSFDDFEYDISFEDEINSLIKLYFDNSMKYSVDKFFSEYSSEVSSEEDFQRNKHNDILDNLKDTFSKNINDFFDNLKR